MLQEEIKKLSSNITSVEKEISSLNSQLENKSHHVSNLINSSSLIDDKIMFGELSRDVKGIKVGTNMKDKNKKILLMKVVIPKEKIEVMKWDHMSQHRAQHVSSHHNKKQPLICHHYGKYGHTRPICFNGLKLNIIGRKEVHANKKVKSNATITSSIAHIQHRSYSSKGWYFNSESSRHMDKDKTTHGNRAKGKIKGSWKLVYLSQEKILLREGLSTNMNQLYNQRGGI